PRRYMAWNIVSARVTGRAGGGTARESGPPVSVAGGASPRVRGRPTRSRNRYAATARQIEDAELVAGTEPPARRRIRVATGRRSTLAGAPGCDDRAVTAVAARPHASAVAELAGALRLGSGRRRRAAGLRGGGRGRGDVRRRHAQQLVPPEVDDALAAELVGSLHCGRERPRAAQLVAERVAGCSRRRSPGRRRSDAGDLRSETSEPRGHLQPARLGDAAAGDRQSERLVPRM